MSCCFGTFVWLLLLVVVSIELDTKFPSPFITVEAFTSPVPQGWRQHHQHQNFVDTINEPNSHHSGYVNTVDPSDSQTSFTRRGRIWGRSKPLSSSASSSSSSSTVVVNRFQNGLQKMAFFVHQATTSWALSLSNDSNNNNNNNISHRKPMKIVKEDGKVEYVPEPPHSTPPSYLLQELKWYDRSINQLDYGGEVRSQQGASLRRRFAWFGKQQHDHVEEEQQQQRATIQQGLRSSKLHAVNEAIAMSTDMLQQQQELEQLQEQQEVEQLEPIHMSLQQQELEQLHEQQEVEQLEPIHMSQEKRKNEQPHKQQEVKQIKRIRMSQKQLEQLEQVRMSKEQHQQQDLKKLGYFFMTQAKQPKKRTTRTKTWKTS